MKKIVVTITTKQFAESDYMDIRDCSLAKALKLILPESEILVGSITVDIDNKLYHISEEVHEIFKRTGKPNQKPLTLTLTSA